MSNAVVTFNGVSFNKAAFKGMKKEDFFKHEAHHGFTKEDMETAWALINEKASTEDNKKEEAGK